MLEWVKTLGTVGMQWMCFAYEKDMNYRDQKVECYSVTDWIMFPQNLCAEVLAPSTSECNCFGR